MAHSNWSIRDLPHLEDGQRKGHTIRYLHPQSLSSRAVSAVFFSLSLLFYAAGLGLYNTSGLSKEAPYEDMGGDSNWAAEFDGCIREFVRFFHVSNNILMKGWTIPFLALQPFLHNKVLALRPRYASWLLHRHRSLRLDDTAGYLVNKHVPLSLHAPYRLRPFYSGGYFWCNPEWPTVHVLFITAYAWAMLLAYKFPIFLTDTQLTSIGLAMLCSSLSLLQSLTLRRKPRNDSISLQG